MEPLLLPTTNYMVNMEKLKREKAMQRHQRIIFYHVAAIIAMVLVIFLILYFHKK